MISSELLKQAPSAGLRRLPPVADLAAVADAAGLRSFAADLSGITSMDTALGTLGRSLAFPDWYGRNLDALMDCLTDMSWAPAEGYLLLLSGTAPLAAAHPRAFQSLLDVFAAAIETWRDDGVPFWVLADEPSLPDAA